MKPWKTFEIRSDALAEEKRFNGATAMKPWKTILALCPMHAFYMLQWGHGDEAVEDTNCFNDCAEVVQASMGPRR